MRKRGFVASVLALASVVVGLETVQALEKGRAVFEEVATGPVVSEIAEK